MSQPSSQDQLTDLLISRAICGLNQSEETELAALQSELGVEDDRSFDRAIAVIDVAVARCEMSRLPDQVRSRVVSDAQEFMVPKPGGTLGDNKTVETKRTTKIQPREMFAWIAFAASLLLSAFLWLQPTVSKTLTIAQLRSVADVKRIEMKPTGDPSSQKVKSAEVLWSDSLQQGFVTYRGLATNDRTIEQYQLWVIDRERGFKERVDGGVFDVPSNTPEVVIPIDAKLRVFEAKGFAVTLEKPEGVPESDLKRVALISENAAD